MKQNKIRQLIMVALMAALMAVISPFTIPVGPVPVTLALFAVFLAGALLRPAAALAAVAVYLLLGFVGLPVFSGFVGGPQVLLGPTGGYLAGYFVAAFMVSLAVQAGGGWWLRFAAMLAGMLGNYVLGSLWFMALTGRGLGESLALCVLPFILPDIAKGAAALALAAALQKRINKAEKAK